MTAWTNVIGWTLVHFVWEGTVIALITALVLGSLRRAPAQFRYAAACVGLLFCLAAPVMTAVSLATQHPFLSSGSVSEAATPLLLKVTSAVTARTGQTALPATETGGANPLDDSFANTWLSTFVGLWVFGVTALTARLALGWWRVRRLHAEALAAPASPWLSAAQRIATCLRLRRTIRVIDCDLVATPAVIGWLQPVVLLPVAALANLSPAQVHAILAHELAHVRRHDFIVNVLQTMAETVLFYHPGVWWLSTRIRTEREHCCDDVAVEVCGDAVGYVEALTALASFATAGSPLVVASTGGSLLRRVRRLLRLPSDADRRRPRAPFVVAASILIVVLAGMRLIVVAQAPGLESDRLPDTSARRIGPGDINRILGFDLFPGPAHYATDDPEAAPAWDVTVAYPGGERKFRGFTARGLIRYGFVLDALPVVDGPSWLDSESKVLRSETSAANPEDADFREAIRVALETQYGLTVRRETRLFPVYGLRIGDSGRLGPNIRPSTVECFDSEHDRLDTIGPTLYARGQQMLFCGVDSSILGPRGFKVTLEQFARSLRGFSMDRVEAGVRQREVVDQTGLSGVYDLELNLGFLPFAAIATAHPNLGITFGPLIRTFPQAIEEQLGLRLVPTDAPREVAVLAAR